MWNHSREESFELLIYLPVDLQKAIHQTLQVAAAAAAAWGSSEWREGGAVTTLPAGRSLQIPSSSSVTTDGRGLHTCVTVWFPWDRNPHHPPGSQDTNTNHKNIDKTTWNEHLTSVKHFIWHWRIFWLLVLFLVWTVRRLSGASGSTRVTVGYGTWDHPFPSVKPHSSTTAPRHRKPTPPGRLFGM